MSNKVKTTTNVIQTKCVEINFKQLLIEDSLQSRAEIDQSLVAEYAEEMLRGTKFPPIIVFSDGAKYWLVDGFHRVLAAKIASLTTIVAEVRTGSMRDALLFSAGVNREHGLRRSNQDKRKSVTILLTDPEWQKWGDRTIAEHCGVSHSFVGSIRAELSVNGLQIERTVARNGGEYSMNTSKIGKNRESSEKSLKVGTGEGQIENGKCLPKTGGDSEIQSAIGNTNTNNPQSNSDNVDVSKQGHEIQELGHDQPIFIASPVEWSKQKWLSLKGAVARDISLAVLVVIPDSTPINKELQAFLKRSGNLNFSVYLTPGLHTILAMPDHEALPQNCAEEIAVVSDHSNGKVVQESPIDDAPKIAPAEAKVRRRRRPKYAAYEQ